MMRSLCGRLRSTQKQPAKVRRYFHEEHFAYAAASKHSLLTARSNNLRVPRRQQALIPLKSTRTRRFEVCARFLFRKRSGMAGAIKRIALATTMFILVMYSAAGQTKGHNSQITKLIGQLQSQNNHERITAMPMTTSRTDSLAVKCFSTWGSCGHRESSRLRRERSRRAGAEEVGSVSWAPRRPIRGIFPFLYTEKTVVLA